jgi:predicted phosphodiesterase
MRIAVVSDTHGDLMLMNTIAREAEADTMVHAGDFGFYDGDSVSLYGIKTHPSFATPV